MVELIDGWRELDSSLELMVVTRTPLGLLQPELDKRGVPWMMLPFQSWVLHKRAVAPADVYHAAREDFAAVRALERLIREFGPDVVITNTIVAPWAAVAAKLVGVPHVWFAHEYGDDHEFSLTPDQTFEDIGILSDLVVTSSRELRGYLSQWIDPGKIDVLYPNLQLSRVESLLAERGSDWSSSFSDDPEALRVICVGRIAESKGQARLVRAIAALKAEGLRVEAALVGSATSDDRARISSLIAEFGVDDHITLTGEVSNPFPYVAESDVGVVVSDSEGFGRVTVEYMTAGKPVIGVRVGATVELVAHQETGLLIEPNDIDDLAAALRTYWNDRDLMRRHGAMAARHVADDISKRHQLSTILDQIGEVVLRGSAPLNSLPHLMMSWMSLPATALELLAASGAMVDPRTSLTWRVGDAALALPRGVVRLLRRGRGTR